MDENERKQAVLNEVSKDTTIPETNRIQAAKMLYSALISDKKTLKDDPSFSHLPQASLAKAEVIFQTIREKYAPEKKEIVTTTQQNIREFRDKISVVDSGPLATYLIKNFSGKLQNTHEWAQQFVRAYKSGKTDISRDPIIGHLPEHQRAMIADVYKQSSLYLLAQDMDRTLVRSYDSNKSKRIAECLARLCAMGVETVDTSHLNMKLSGGMSLSSLGIQADQGSVEDSMGGMGMYAHARLSTLNATYHNFVSENYPAQVALNTSKAQNARDIDRIADSMNVSPDTIQNNNRPFSPGNVSEGGSPGDNMEDFQKRMVANKQDLHARMKAKGINI